MGPGFRHGKSMGIFSYAYELLVAVLIAICKGFCAHIVIDLWLRKIATVFSVCCTKFITCDRVRFVSIEPVIRRKFVVHKETLATTPWFYPVAKKKNRSVVPTIY